MHALLLDLSSPQHHHHHLDKNSFKEGPIKEENLLSLLNVLKPSQPQDLRTWGVTLLFINLPVPYQQTVRIRLSKKTEKHHHHPFLSLYM